MHRRHWIAVLLVLVLIPPLAIASVNPGLRAVTVDAEAAARDAIHTANRHYQNRDDEAALRGFKAAIALPGFKRLSDEQRHAVLLLTGALALQRADAASAYPLLKRASAFEQAGAEDWHKRLGAAYALRDYNDSAVSLTTIARRWPETLSDVYSQAIYRVVNQLEKDGNSASAHRNLLQALFDANWQDDGQQPSTLWLDLARLQLKDDKVDLAKNVASRIDATRTLLAMQVDRRFDPVTAGRLFDLDRSMRDELTRARKRADAAPDRLRPKIDLQYLLLGTLQFDEALAIADEVIARVGEADGSKAFTDFDDEYVWLLDTRARALRRLGRWDEAVVQQRRVARRPEHGELNVSQALNLGVYYASTREPEKALDAIADVGNMSGYGRMVREGILLLVALQKDGDKAVAKHLAYLREHRDEGIGAYQEALLQANRLDDAEALLIERLRNERWRSRALLEMQDYADIKLTPIDELTEQRRNLLGDRPAVVAELKKAGRVLRVSFAPEEN